MWIEPKLPFKKLAPVPLVLPPILVLACPVVPVIPGIVPVVDNWLPFLYTRIVVPLEVTVILFQLVFVIVESLSTTTDDPAPSEYKKRKV